MQIKIRLFAILKDLTRQSELVLESVKPLRCGEAAACVSERFPETRAVLEQCWFARNGTEVEEDALLANGDELVILPPASGG